MSTKQLVVKNVPKIGVLVATPLGRFGQGGIDRIMDELRLQLARAPIADIEVSFATTRGQGHIALSPLYLARSILTLVAGKLSGKFNLLHVNLSSHGSTKRKILLCRAARLVGLPYVIHLHGSRFRHYVEAARGKSAAEIDAMLRGAVRILVLGRVWQAFLSQRLPDIADRIDIVPNASRAPATLAEKQGPSVTILFLGQIGPRKGVPQLVDAFHRLAAVPGWRGVIAGNGMVAETRAEIARLGLADRVEVPGWVGPEAVDRLLASADILVLPSFDENQPLSVIEGMAYQLAVVATPVGAVEDIIADGKTGLLVPPGDAARLAEALGRLVTDAELRHRLALAAQGFHRDNLDMGLYLPRLAAIWRAAVLAGPALRG